MIQLNDTAKQHKNLRLFAMNSTKLSHDPNIAFTAMVLKVGTISSVTLEDTRQ